MSNKELKQRLQHLQVSAEYADDESTMAAVDIVAAGLGLEGFGKPVGWSVISTDRLIELRRRAGDL